MTRWQEIDVTIESEVKLSGSLSIPIIQTNPLPAILIVGGTGKIDRDGRLNKKINLQLYRQLSEFLNEAGFITLRYDKRGVASSEGDYNRTGLWDLVSDAQSAIQFLKNRSEVDEEKVILLGHSEGCTIGTAVAVKEPLGGLLLLAGAVERLEEALFRQRQIATIDILNAKGFMGWLLRALGAHKKVEKQAQNFLQKVLASTDDTIKIQFQTVNAKWMREHFAYNVLHDLSRVNCPSLAITGKLDIQANPDRLQELTDFVKENATSYVIDQMGHSMKYQEKPSNIFTLKKDIIRESSLPLHPEFVKILNQWLERYQH